MDSDLQHVRAGRHHADDDAVTLALCPVCSLEMPPVGIASLASALRHRGFQARAIDLNARAFQSFRDHLGDHWENRKLLDLVDERRFIATKTVLEPIIDYCVRELLETTSRFIGFSIFRTNLLFSCEVASRIRLRDSSRVILFGGPSTSVPGERLQILKRGGELVLVGECEVALPDLVASSETLTSCSAMGSTTPVRAFQGPTCSKNIVSDLNTIPFPDFHDFDLRLYSSRDRFGEPVLPIIGSRGCIMRCSYCSDHVLANPYRFRKADHIVSEIAWHHRSLGVRSFFFGDLLFNGNLKELGKLADLLLKNGPRITWTGQAIPRVDMTGELLSKLARSGLVKMTLGVESASKKIRSLMNKPSSFIDPETVLRRCRDSGIETAINLIVGFPGETARDFQETADFLRRNREFIGRVDNIHPLYITPQSPLEADPCSFGINPLSDLPVDRSILWTGVDGSDYKARRSRVLDLVSELEVLGIEFNRASLDLYQP